MTFWDYWALIRSLVYLWVAAISFSLFQLYRDSAVLNDKRSPIIEALIKILKWTSITITLHSACAFSHILNKDAHNIINIISPFVMVPLGILLINFRRQSVTRHEEFVSDLDEQIKDK